MGNLSMSVDLSPSSLELDNSTPKMITLQQVLVSQQFVVKIKSIKCSSTVVKRITLESGKS